MIDYYVCARGGGVDIRNIYSIIQLEVLLAVHIIITFSFTQGCTVGNNKGVYPKFGERIVMCPNSMVLGNCNIGSNVVLAANAYVEDEDIPNNSIVFGSTPNLVIKKNQQERVDWMLQQRFKCSV